jgi:hypothetical protein
MLQGVLEIANSYMDQQQEKKERGDAKAREERRKEKPRENETGLLAKQSSSAKLGSLKTRENPGEHRERQLVHSA